MDLRFKQVSEDEELNKCLDVIRTSFLTVAGEFKLTIENAPTNPAFIGINHLVKMRQKGIAMFAVYHEDIQIGFVAIEKAKDDTYYMEKVAVLPEFRHRGFGKMIMNYVADYVSKNGGKRIGIGIINENTILKKWYLNYGFKEIELKKFDHLPFTVCLMSKEVQ